MTIHYCLYENSLVTDTTEFAARVKTYDSVGLPDLADRIVKMGTTVTRTDVLAVLESMCEACEDFLLDGKRVTVGGVFELYPRIRGKFTSMSDSFDPARHTLDAAGNAGSRVRNAVHGNGSVEKVTTHLPMPIVYNYIDTATGEMNNIVTAGNVGTLEGQKLQFNKEAADEGIWFISTGGTETKVTSVTENNPAKLIYLVPALMEVHYHVEVRTRYTEDGALRTGRLDSQLTAVPAP